MSILSKFDRIEALMRGKPADRPPVSVWHHFLKEETDAERFVEATAAFQEKYDWDVIKVNPRAVYFTETWGNEYDYSTYIGYGPKPVKSVLQCAEDLHHITRRGIDCPTLSEQLHVVSALRKRVGANVPIIQTVYSPLGILLNLTGTRLIGRNRQALREESPIVHFIREDPTGLKQALEAVAETMHDYVAALLAAGANGLFYAALGLAREGYLTFDEWRTYCRAYDLEILAAAKDSFTVLHTCGISANPQYFADYPIKVLHWAESDSGNPTLASSADWLGNMAIMGGVDEDLFGQGKADEIFRQAKLSVERHKDRPFFLAPECSVSPSSADEDYLALRSACE